MPEPGVESLSQGLAQAKGPAVERGSRAEALEDGRHVEALGVKHGVRAADRCVVMCIAACSHGETTGTGVMQRTFVLYGHRRGRIEDFESIHRERVQSGLANPSTHPVVGMRGYGDSARRVHALDDFNGGRMFKPVWKPYPKAKQMSLRCRYFRSGNNQKSIHGLAIFAKESFFKQIPATVTGVMVGEGKTVQSAFARRFDERFRTAHSVP